MPVNGQPKYRQARTRLVEPAIAPDICGQTIYLAPASQAPADPANNVDGPPMLKQEQRWDHPPYWGTGPGRLMYAPGTGTARQHPERGPEGKPGRPRSTPGADRKASRADPGAPRTGDRKASRDATASQHPDREGPPRPGSEPARRPLSDGPGLHPPGLSDRFLAPAQAELSLVVTTRLLGLRRRFRRRSGDRAAEGRGSDQGPRE